MHRFFSCITNAMTESSTDLTACTESGRTVKALKYGIGKSLPSGACERAFSLCPCSAQRPSPVTGFECMRFGA